MGHIQKRFSLRMLRLQCDAWSLPRNFLDEFLFLRLSNLDLTFQKDQIKQ